MLHRLETALIIIRYEVISIDDHSTDETVPMIGLAQNAQPLHRNITTYTKVGIRGTFSLLEATMNDDDVIVTNR